MLSDRPKKKNKTDMYFFQKNHIEKNALFIQ